MSPPLKRILLIVGLLILATLIGYGLYYAFIRTRPTIVPPPVITPPGGPPAALPGAGERAPITPGVTPPAGVTVPPSAITPPPEPTIFRPAATLRVSQDFATYPSLQRNTGAVRYHNAGNGKFYRLNPDGSIRELSSQVFYNVSRVTWAAAQDKAVLEYPDGAKIVYDFERERQSTLPKHWEEFSWSGDGNEIAAKSLGLSPENRWLVVSQSDGSATRLIEPLGENADRVIVDWSPSRQTVAFAQTGEPLGTDRREVLFVGLQGENFKSTIVEGLDFQPQWSPSGQRLLYSVDSARSNFKPELWVVDAFGDRIGNNRRNLKINTWANKCAWAGEDSLFCAVPRDLPTGAGMAPEIAAGTSDDLYRIDLSTGLRTTIPLDGDFRVSNISYDPTNQKIYFTDATESGVWAVPL